MHGKDGRAGQIGKAGRVDQAGSAEEDMKAREAGRIVQGNHGRHPEQGTQESLAG